jgi:hypothetical protein
MAFVEPDLTAALGTATAANNWGPNDAKQAKNWFVNFLQAVKNAGAGTSINVLNRKADYLWHVFKEDPNYNTYCTNTFGYVLQHIELPQPRKPTPDELDAVRAYYEPNWPIPDPYCACRT